jgi:alkaline phosphatase D
MASTPIATARRKPSSLSFSPRLSTHTFSSFHTFREFVAGPLHAGTFGPNDLDPTFGPELKFCAVPAGMKPNRPPSEGLQFFGTIEIDGRSEVMMVSLLNAAGERLYRVELVPERGP